MQSKYSVKFKRAKEFLNVVAPGLWVLVHKFKISVSEEALNAYFDPREMEIVIPQRYMNSMTEAELAALLSHEALHGVLAHWVPPRHSRLIQPVWNLACDVEANYVLEELGLFSPLERFSERVVGGKPVSWRLFTHYDVHPTDPAETVYFKILKDSDHILLVIRFTPPWKDYGEREQGEGFGEREEQGEVAPSSSGRGARPPSDVTVIIDVIPKDEMKRREGKHEKRETLWEGDEEFREGVKEYSETGNMDLVKKIMANALAEMIEAQKMAGNVPEGLLRRLKKMLSHEVPWNRLLKNALVEGLGKSYRTWQRPNRRLIPNVPGAISKGNRIWCLIDTSGSISDDELAKFAGEVAYASKYASKVFIVSWDADVYEVMSARSPSRVKEILKEHLKGGGGTVPEAALRKLLNKMRFGDAVILLTDGYWWDENESELEKLMRSIKRISSAAILVTTGEVPEVARKAHWKVIRIKSTSSEVNSI